MSQRQTLANSGVVGVVHTCNLSRTESVSRVVVSLHDLCRNGTSFPAALETHGLFLRKQGLSES